MAVCVLSPAWALADARVTTVAGIEWPALVASFQSDTSSQGRAVDLCVRDEHTDRCMPCGSYSLAFDEAGAQAFRVEACAASTGASRVTLVDRTALFDHSHAVPRPRAVTVRAAIVSSIETSGGAASTGGSAVGCTARVRPYLRDLEHGANVYLGPDQYDVRVLHAGVEVTAFGNGWMLASESRVDAEVDYDVTERSSGEVVMTGHASLECASETLTTIDAGPGLSYETRSSQPAGATTIDRSDFGSLPEIDGIANGGNDSFGGCVGHYASVVHHRIDVVAPVDQIEIHAETAGDATLAVQTADGSWHCNDDGGRYPHTLDPIVVLAAPPVGAVEIYVGTYSAGAELPYRLHVIQPGVVERTDGSFASLVTTRHHRRPIPGLLVSGVLTSIASWVFMAGFDVLPQSACEGGGCPNDTWRSVAWIPFVGPWVAESLAGANGASFTGPAIADGVFQDLGLLFMIFSAIGQDRPVSVALGDAADAPHLALGGGPGTALGATLTF